MGNFYSRLSYSFGNEDWNTEFKALQITAKDTVLCVTASGDRPLNLLTQELKEIVAVDANPLQNALFDLKKVALAKLSFDDYSAFLGIKPCKNRLQTYSQLANHLDPMANALWERLPKAIHKGVIYEGSVEKLLKVASVCFRALRGKKIKRLFSINNIEDQQRYLADHWHTYLLKKAFQIGLHPKLTKIFVKDPGLYENIDTEIHVGNQLYDRLHNYLNHNLANKSILLSMIFMGKVESNSYPPYLTEEGVSKIKQQVGKARFATEDLVSFISKAEASSFDCFSISDVASYLCKEQFDVLIEGMYRCAKPGARFCIRQFLSNHQIPAHMSRHFKRNLDLEKKLQQEDRCCVYKFMTGQINK